MKYKSLRTDTVSARQWWHSASENWRGKTCRAISISERQVKQEGSQRRRGRAGRTSGGDVCENVAVFNGGGLRSPNNGPGGPPRALSPMAANTQARTRTHTRTHTHLHIAHIHIHACAHIHTHTHTHAHTNAHTYTHMHEHTHTYTHSGGEDLIVQRCVCVASLSRRFHISLLLRVVMEI